MATGTTTRRGSKSRDQGLTLKIVCPKLKILARL